MTAPVMATCGHCGMPAITDPVTTWCARCQMVVCAGCGAHNCPQPRPACTHEDIKLIQAWECRCGKVWSAEAD